MRIDSYAGCMGCLYDILLNMIKKTVLMNVEKVYTANSFICGNKRFVAAGSEVGPEVKLLDFSSGESRLVSG